MTTERLRKALKHLHQVLHPTGGDALTDGQLLARFIASRDEAAFAALVRRHGPMVLGVCRRILRHTQDAEDAFQAAFLVLARKANSVANRQAVGSWLYRVSCRIALESKAINDKRRTREKQVEAMPHPEVDPREVQDWRPLLDRELNLLPESYRAVIVTCDLEGRSRKEAARHLGLSEGTVSSRLTRGRRLLAKRLSRYGVSLPGGVLAATMAEGAASAVPVPLVSATVLAALGQGAISASVGLLVKGALKTMLLTKLKLAVGAVVIVAALGVSGLAYRAAGESPSASAKTADQAPSVPAEKKKSDGKPPSELEILRQEVELLKLKMEVVQQKLRAQEAELRAIRTGVTDDMKKRAGSDPTLTAPQIAEAELYGLRAQHQEYHRRYLSQMEQNRRQPGSVPKDERVATIEVTVHPWRSN
jgi:RNA polymerase sigma factor (sigma-70 family)